MNLPALRSPADVVLALQQPFTELLASTRQQLVADAAQARERKKIAAALKVATDADYENAAAGLVAVMKHLDGLEEQRTALTKPLNAILRSINAVFGPSKKEWTEVSELARAATMAYTAARRASADAAAVAAQRLAMSAQPIVGIGPQAASYQALSAHAAAPLPSAPGLSETEHWAWELVDPRLVPRELLQVDEKKVNQLVHTFKGGANIPGIRVYRADFTTVRRP